MKNIAIMIILISLFWSCKQDEILTPVYRLKNCAVEYLNFFDDNKYLNNSALTFPANDSLKTVVTFKYDSDNVIQSIGGFMNAPNGVNFTNLCFSTNVYDSIVYSGNEIWIYTKPNVFYSSSLSTKENPQSPTIYTLDQDG